jgi:hypothetical protein
MAQCSDATVTYLLARVLLLALALGRVTVTPGRLALPRRVTVTPGRLALPRCIAHGPLPPRAAVDLSGHACSDGTIPAELLLPVCVRASEGVAGSAVYDVDHLRGGSR